MCKAIWISGLVVAGAVVAGLGYYAGTLSNHHKTVVYGHAPLQKPVTHAQFQNHPHYTTYHTTISENPIPKTSNVIVTPYEHTKTVKSDDGHKVQTITTGEKGGVQYKIVQTKFEGKHPSKAYEHQMHALQAENIALQRQMDAMFRNFDKQFGEMPHVQIMLEPGPVIQNPKN